MRLAIGDMLTMMPDKEKMAKYYEDLFEKHGYHYRALDWKDPVGQKIRYQVLFSIISFFTKRKNISVLDLGSGLGHFYGWLKDNKLLKDHKIDYTGYDISPKLVEAAKKKYPEAKFEVRDILEGYFTDRFDIIFCSGIFNIILSDEAEHMSFVKEMLKRMYEASSLGVAVNFLSIAGSFYAPDKTKEGKDVYFYYKPEDMAGYVRSFSPKFVLRHDYHPGDFTVYLLKGR